MHGQINHNNDININITHNSQSSYRISSLSTSADSNIVPFIRPDKSKAETKKVPKFKTSHAGYHFSPN